MSATSTIVQPPDNVSNRNLGAPVWAVELLRGSHAQLAQTCAYSISIQKTDHFSLVSVVAPNTHLLDSEEFEARTAEAYTAIASALQNCPARHPVRLWNHLPQIHAPSGDGTDRYMAFNAGRFRSYTRWLGSAGDFDRTVPTASAVGHEGNELVIHALAHKIPGRAVANPRQIAPYRYSKRYGPVPPCFARATVLPAANGKLSRVLVGGTASIRGEESVYLDDIGRQTAETFENLAVLIRAVSEIPLPNAPAVPTDELRFLLKHFRHLRVYHPREANRAFLEARIAETFAPDCRVEFAQADLCRAELLVEIEGLAEL